MLERWADLKVGLYKEPTVDLRELEVGFYRERVDVGIP